MKTKLILIIFLLSVVFSASAKPVYYRAGAICISSDNVNLTSWKEVSLLVAIDFEEQRVVINSADVQIIDYVIKKETIGRDYIAVECVATDKHYKNILLTFHKSDSGNLSLIINYPDYFYAYLLTKI